MLISPASSCVVNNPVLKLCAFDAASYRCLGLFIKDCTILKIKIKDLDAKFYHSKISE
jgi:hypothetical protein